LATRIFLALFTVAIASAPAHAQQSAGAGAPASNAASAPPSPSPAPAPQQPPATAPHKTSLADFAWLEGRWRGDWVSRVAEQTWLGPKAGEMTGTFRLVEGDKILVLELFTLVEKPEGINFYFRHFTPELVPWEKSDATLLNLESSDAQKAVFTNPLNGEPRRVILLEIDADTYTARAEIEPEHGDPQTIEITYHRQKPPAAAPSGGNGGRRKKP
jgi:hypothetical protein